VNKKYKIFINGYLRHGRIKEIEKIFTVLFAYGFLFTEGKRRKAYDEVKRDFTDDDMRDWNCIIFGYSDCKRVFGIKQFPFSDEESKEYKEVTLDEFLDEYLIGEMTDELSSPNVVEGSSPSDPTNLFNYLQPV